MVPGDCFPALDALKLCERASIATAFFFQLKLHDERNSKLSLLAQVKRQNSLR